MSQQIKYGKVEFKVQDAEKLGNFALDKNTNLSYTPF